MTEINRWGAEWRNDLQIGDNPRFVSEFYQPLRAFSGYFVAPRLELERDTVFLLIDHQGDQKRSSEHRRSGCHGPRLLPRWWRRWLTGLSPWAESCRHPGRAAALQHPPRL